MKEHRFLSYKHAEIFFTYGFLWRPSTGIVRKGAFSTYEMSRDSGGWRAPLVHERVIGKLGRDLTERLWIGSYQPSFVLQRRCLEWNLDLGDGLALVVPLEHGIELPKRGDLKAFAVFRSKEFLSVPVRATLTIRLLDNGSGVATFRIQPELNSLPSPQSRFEVLHQALRLSPNMDLVPEEHDDARQVASDNFPVCDSFLLVPSEGTIRLFPLMMKLRREALARFPKDMCAESTARIVADDGGFAYQDPSEEPPEDLIQRPLGLSIYDSLGWRENQTPFTFVVCVVDEESIERLQRPALDTAKEVASIFARFTLDNRFVSRDFARLSEHYMARYLGYSPEHGRLANHSHDERLFFTFGRRGAIALTSAPGTIPTVFVVPSLLNLFEILRARLTGGILVGCRLARIAESLSELDVGSEGPHTSEEVFAYLRKFVVQNQQSPLDHLFDGGSATELALAAEEILLASRVWRNVQDSFEAVDRLRSAWLDKRFRVKYGD